MNSPLSFLVTGVLGVALLGMMSCGPSGNSSSGGGSASTEAAEQPPKGPSTEAEAVRVLDLNKFPIMDSIDSDKGAQKTLGNVGYQAKADVKSAYEFQRKNLLAQRWKEQPGATVTDQYASGTFSRNTFTLSVLVSPVSQPGVVDVRLHNHGNVDLGKLPVPPNVKSVYVGPATAMYVTEASVADTAQACRALLNKAGWEPHGSVADTFYVKQNMIRLTVTVSSAPAQGGKTMISYASELMSADLPAPPDAEQVQYIDQLRRLTFDSPSTKEAIATFYKQALAKSGWKANQAELIRVDDKDEMVFRAGDGVTFLEISEGDDNKRSVSIGSTTHAEMDAAAERMKRKLAKEKAKGK